ncbi:MAG: YhcH/YjgK/YiaL family protein [Armatimonadota bacterium]
MILDRLDNADRYADMHPRFEAAFDLLREFDFESAPDGPAEIDGRRLTINVLRGKLNAREDAILEAHEQYVDIQYVVSGNEVFGWKATEDCQQPTMAYDPEKDVILFEDAPDAYIPLLEGMFVVFFPGDAHAPMLGEGDIEKIVVKVLL